MRVTDYDSIASAYDWRYELQKYRGIQAALLDFAGASGSSILEVGAGTGHWLAFLHGHGYPVTGLDPSANMLAGARRSAPAVPLLRARAEALPYASETFGGVFAVNVLHHLSDRRQFLAEARRVLRSGGGVMTMGLDPHAGGDRWWIYEYFPESLPLDRERYPAAGRIRAEMAQVGFVRCETRSVQHLLKTLSIEEAKSRGLFARASTSQLTILSEDEYQRGLDRLDAAAALGSAEGRTPLLETDLRLYATIGWVP